MTQREKDNRGFTFIELLTAVSILAIVMVSLAFIMSYSSGNYRNLNDEVILQTEGQIIINQINDLIIEGYNVKFSPSGELTIYQEDVTYVILFDTIKHQLDFKKFTPEGIQIGNKELLGKYVEEFQVVDTGADDSNKQIKVSLSLKKEKSTFQLKDQVITLRNKIKPVP
ncbi:prepilin-type N-terminal cleavage/methylation domain-containing protein [Anaerocolumna aminovalerica]|uniref:PulJ/GspJ family protein n=1 Tax=Anaerocolumna aminovalerica TaxID=1527 RepID=UPI001C0EE4EC|nr:prepilin-type N-terminal cleavage/methylation domain-containing protein [Anaerocolumna aminovalerica]